MDEEREAIIEFLQSEDGDPAVWPWALSAEEIAQNDDLLRKVERVVNFDQQGDYNTEELCAALDRIVGVNPALKERSAPDSGMAQPCM